MDWSPQQLQALDDVGRWLSDRLSPVYYLAGWAGTGKTELAKHLAEGVDKVLFAAYTGKAASVMRRRGCPNASTIHQLIYLPANRSKYHLDELEGALNELLSELAITNPGEDQSKHPKVVRLNSLIEEENRRLRRPMFVVNHESPVGDANLVVIDECSMISEQIGLDLLSFETPILVLGDPAQLPPVRGGGYFTNRKPNMMLTEIHRQARDNPIIDLATKVRQRELLSDGQYGNSLVMTGKPPQELVFNAEQILVGLNATRRKCNSRMRELLGRQEILPMKDDKLVCLRNDHDEGLLNGTLWMVNSTVPESDGPDRIVLELTSESGGSSVVVEAHTHYFEGRENELSHWVVREAQCFDYGYALTVHKAQGSQWESVFVFDESRAFRESANQWLYTAITRASEKVVICRN